MGLDWVVQDRLVDGRMVDAWETLGARRFDRGDPKHVARFRQHYEEEKARIKPPPKPGWFGFYPGWEEPSTTRHREFWGRPFEEVMADFDRIDPPPLVGDIDPAENAGLAAVSGGAVRICDFRSQLLDAESNAVIACTGFDSLRIWLDMQPDEMLKLAEDLEAALAQFRGMGERDGEEDEGFVEAAVGWLRYWAGKGHSIKVSV